MRGRRIHLGLLLLLAACSAGDDGVPDDSNSVSEVQLVDGQAVCDSCTSVRIALTGPGIVGVTEAALVPSGTVRTPIPARIVLARESSASGEVLVVNVFFDAGITTGEFDLWLDPVSDGDGARIVRSALRVTRARPGVGDLATVRVWVQVSGTDRDGRFDLLTVAGCQSGPCDPVPVEAYEATALPLLPGGYTFRLDDVADNCTVGGAPNPASVTLERGKVTALTYTVTCTQTSTPGWVRISNVTSGASLDDEYLVTCSTYTCLPFRLAANRDTVLRVLAGELTIRIGEVAPNCTLTGASSVSATAVIGDTATVGFAIDCRTVPGVRVTIRTTGRDVDTGFRIDACSSDWYGPPCEYRYTTSNDVVTLPNLQPGTYEISLRELAENCGLNGPSSQMVVVTGGIVEVAFDVTCRAYGTVRVSAVTTGTNQDLSYMVVRPAGCDDWYYACEQGVLTTSGSVDFRAAPVPQSFELRDVAPNCTVTAPSNPAVVTAIEDGVVELRFEVACR
jgi:hypothetical protein